MGYIYPCANGDHENCQRTHPGSIRCQCDCHREHPARISDELLPSGRVYVYHADGTLSISSFGLNGVLGSPVRAAIGDQIEVRLNPDL